MKKYTAILEEIKKNRASIEAKTDEIMKLDSIEERRAAAEAGNFEEVHRLRDEAAKNAEKIGKLSDEIQHLEVLERILQNNANAARTAEALPIICGVWKKYNGKKYGPKTADKIREELHAAGYSAYFEHGYILNFEELDANGYTHCNRLSIYGLYCNKVITDENTIDAAGLDCLKSNYIYIENPEERAAAIIAKAAEVKKAYEAAAAIASEYNELIAGGIKSADYPKFNKIYFVK